MNSVARLFRTFLAILREVFDESAYKRFLQSSHIPSSPAAYAAFGVNAKPASRVVPAVADRSFSFEL